MLTHHSLDYGTFLTEIALDGAVSWPLRQLASVMLKKYINVHWSKNSDKFLEPEVNAEHKIRIKAMLLNGKWSRHLQVLIVFLQL